MSGAVVRRGRLHWATALHILRKSLVLYLLPLVQVAFRMEWASLLAALRQDLVLFAGILAVAGCILRFGWWELDSQGALHLHWHWVVHLQQRIPAGALAAVVVERRPALRLVGAARITFYEQHKPAGRCRSLLLAKADAQLLADAMLPAAHASPAARLYWRPALGERVRLAVLHMNNPTSLLFWVLAFRQVRAYAPQLQQLAFLQLSRTAAWAARWLPTGLAWLFALLVLLETASLCRSLLHTLRFAVWQNGSCLTLESGVLVRESCRIRLAAVSLTDLRFSPLARLLHRRPVYLTAGGYTTALPVLLLRPGDDAAGLLGRLLPGFALPPTHAVFRGRPPSMLLPAALPFGIAALLAVLARRALPALTPLLLVVTAYCFVRFICGLEGYLREGAWLRDGSLTARRQQHFTMHNLCVLPKTAGCRLLQSPWAAQKGRATLTLMLPAGVRVRIRSMPLADALRCVYPNPAGSAQRYPGDIL